MIFSNREILQPREPKRRRRDIFVERDQPKAASSVRSDIFRPYGAWAFVAGGSTKMSPLTGLGFGARETSGLSRRLVTPKCDEGGSGWDFLSPPDTRLKPGANESGLSIMRIAICGFDETQF